jgi:CheY-like chemotaxis protein
LENAVLNLAINARDAMVGGGSLSIGAGNFSIGEHDETALDLRPGEYVSIAVGDTGSGMPRDVMDHVFEPFYTTKETGHGSGLGLSMVYGFIKQSGGDVTIDSEEGVGTTVTMYLPKSMESLDGVLSHEGGAEPRARGETILVVEDDADVRALSVSLLEDLGYKILEAKDGETAERALKQNPGVDLLLTDVMLPSGKSGLEIAEQAYRNFPAMPILFMSGYTADTAIHQGLSKLKAEILKNRFAGRTWRKRCGPPSTIRDRHNHRAHPACPVRDFKAPFGPRRAEPMERARL